VSGQQDTCGLGPWWWTHSVTSQVAWIFISCAVRTFEMSRKFTCVFIQAKNVFSCAFCIFV